MQYFPQQEPPTHSPSEVYTPVEEYRPQMQLYAQQYPGQKITQPSWQDQEIIIYPNRTRAIALTIYCGIILAFAIMTLAGAIALFDLLGITFQSKSIVPLLIYLALWLPVFAFGGWATWSTAQFAFKRTPLLIIDHQGITVGKSPAVSGFFIPWREIEAIHTYTFMSKYLCIRPKDTKQFLKCFNILERFNRLSNVIIGMPALVIPQNLLESPIEEILSQLQMFYAHELETHHIRLRP